MKLAACQMQPTGETWLGNIPAAWTFKRLKYCVQTLTDKVDKVPDDREYIGLESIESGTGRLLQRESPLIAEGGAALFECNDVLFCKLRPYLAKTAKGLAGCLPASLATSRSQPLERPPPDGLPVPLGQPPPFPCPFPPLYMFIFCLSFCLRFPVFRSFRTGCCNDK